MELSLITSQSTPSSETPSQATPITFTVKYFTLTLLEYLLWDELEDELESDGDGLEFQKPPLCLELGVDGS